MGSRGKGAGRDRRGGEGNGGGGGEVGRVRGREGMERKGEDRSNSEEGKGEWKERGDRSELTKVLFCSSPVEVYPDLPGIVVPHTGVLLIVQSVQSSTDSVIHLQVRNTETGV